jgi:hypothetical protein
MENTFSVVFAKILFKVFSFAGSKNKIQLTFGLISTCISIFAGFRRGSVADLSVISACEVLVVSGIDVSITESGNMVSK